MKSCLFDDAKVGVFFVVRMDKSVFEVDKN